MNTTLAIVGSHPRTRGLFDFSRSDVDVWAFNEALSNKTIPRANVIFQMHVPPIWRNPQNRNDPGHFAWLQSQNDCDVYMQDKYEDVPRSLTYPISEIQAMIASPDHFLSSSVPQAMALAAYLKQYKRVEIYGVAMETNTEYQFQREGVAFWYGYLKGQGVDVYFADETFRCLLYGYEGEVSIPYSTFDERIAELQPELDTMSSEYSALNMGALKIVEKFAEGDNTKDIVAIIQSLVELSDKLGKVSGAQQENIRYKGKADAMREASGGEFIFSRQEFESGAKTHSDNATKLQADVNQIGGKAELIHQSIVKAAKNSPRRKKLIEAYKNLMGEYLQTHNLMSLYLGAANENYRYMVRLDKGVRAAGGEKSEAVLLEAANV